MLRKSPILLLTLFLLGPALAREFQNMKVAALAMWPYFAGSALLWIPAWWLFGWSNQVLRRAWRVQWALFFGVWAFIGIAVCILMAAYIGAMVCVVLGAILMTLLTDE